MSTNKDDHCVMKNGGFFCSNCGEKYIPNLPAPVNMFTGMADSFIAAHRHCLKTWTAPVAVLPMNVDAQIEFWLEYGDTGISSKTIVSKLSPRTLLPVERWHHPIDPADFSRCLQLLEIIPSFRAKLGVMADVSPEWKTLVENWDALTGMLANDSDEMYQAMKNLGL